MGLLTDPSAGHGRFVLTMIKFHNYVSFLLYTAGIVWFFCLALNRFNSETYFSENALLPGLVHTEFHDPHATQRYHSELLDEMKNYDDGLPYPWILGKMRQIGLEAYTHKFTLEHPLKGSTMNYTGRNVYGIMRAPRAASTEALVLSAPYRPPTSVHESTAASIAYLLAFAEFAQKGKYWAKDIIFLVTEHEQLGMQAWLEAYHGVTCGTPGVLQHGELKGRAGAIQAAVNLEFHELRLGRLEIKVEGLNGQLPNLDLFNLVSRLCIRESIPHTFKGRYFRDYSSHDTKSNLITMLNMVAAQAPGIPTGNHGLFFRFGIQALTLEGMESRKNVNQRLTSVSSQQRLIESTFRSLNNLLERFHQSYFFYLLTATDRFVSIGLYMPALCLLAATCFLKAYIKWCVLNKNYIANDITDEEFDKLIGYKDKELGSGIEPPKRTKSEYKKLFEKECIKTYEFHKREFHFGTLFTAFLLPHLFGALVKFSPKSIVQVGANFGVSTEDSILTGLMFGATVMLLFPFFLPRMNYRTAALLNIFAILELGTILICISMFNISLAMCLAIVSVPLALLVYPSSSTLKNIFQIVIIAIVHPLFIVHAILIAYTKFHFPSESLVEILYRSLSATKNAITFSIIDSEIYGNWLYGVITLVIWPIWLCLFSSIRYIDSENEYSQFSEGQNAMHLEKKASKIPVSLPKEKKKETVSGKSQPKTSAAKNKKNKTE